MAQLLGEREEIVNNVLDALDDEHGINEKACNIVLQYAEEHLGCMRAEFLQSKLEVEEGRFFIYEGDRDELYSELMK